MNATLAGCVALVATLCGLDARAAPYRPATDDTVVATLPGGLPRSTARPGAVAAGPSGPLNVADAEVMARALIGRARTSGDPRDLGRAQAVLARWTDMNTAPIDILVLQATVDQSLHHFTRARVALDAVLQREPRNAQALLTRATVLQVQGQLEAAARDCAVLARTGESLIATACASSVASLQGRGRAAYVMLDFTLRSAGEQPAAGVRAWVNTVLASLAERNGDAASAAIHYQAALALAATDRYVIGSYADFLLDHGEAQAAQVLTRNRLMDDALLLRQALARARLGRSDTAAATAMLAERFAEARQRGDMLHLREEARFELHLRHDGRRALALAKQNWALPQREPEDARILLEAATAAGDASTRLNLLKWFERAGVADEYLACFDLSGRPRALEPQPVRFANEAHP
jgi:Tfp pilus assembly protein PilF